MKRKTPKHPKTTSRRQRTKRRARKNPGIQRAGKGLDFTITGTKDPAPTLAALIGAKGPLTRIARTVYWPKDWWQHLKQRFAPNWVLLRWPVRTDGVTFWEDVATEDSTTTSTTSGSNSVTATFTASTPIEPSTLVTVGGVPIGVASKSETAEATVVTNTRTWAQVGWDDKNENREPVAPTVGGRESYNEYWRGWYLRIDDEPRPID